MVRVGADAGALAPDAVAEHGERVVQTRWVPPVAKRGSWVPYFQRFPFADRSPHDPIFDLVD